MALVAAHAPGIDDVVAALVTPRNGCETRQFAAVFLDAVDEAELHARGILAPDALP